MVYLIRHGQTALNNAMLLQGRSDHPLNEAGEQQAGRTGEWFHAQGIVFSRVFASPLRRAVQTAEWIAGGVPIEIDERLIEMDYGPYEGADLKNPPPEVLAFFQDFTNHPAPEGMEPLSAIVKRLGAFLEEIRPAVGEGNILVSTHAIAMKGALEYLTPDARGRYWSRNIGNCAVYVTALEDGRYSVPVELRTDTRAEERDFR